MKITKKWLDKWDACEEGRAWFWAQDERDHLKCVEKLVKEKRLIWANWTIVRDMTREQYLAYAIYAARQVLGVFEKNFPDDKRPIAAIEAAEKCLKQNTLKNREAAGAAAWAAREAAVAAARTAREATMAAARTAREAAMAARDAGGAAMAAALAAGDADAARAAGAAAWAAREAAMAAAREATMAARDAGDAGAKMQLKILRHGLKLLKEEVKP